MKLPRPVSLALCLTVGAGLPACTPSPEGIRVDITARADGLCNMERYQLPCSDVGKQAVAKHPGQAVHAVLLIDDDTPSHVKEDLITSLQRAQVSHIQFGLVADDTSQRGKLVF